MAGYSYKNSINFKVPEESEEYNIESCDVLDYHNIKNILDKINEKDVIIEEYITKYISEEEKLMTYNFKPTTKNIMDSNMLMLYIMNPSIQFQSSQPPDDDNINKPEMIEKMKFIPFHFESEKQRQIRILKIRYERMTAKLVDYDRKNKIKEKLKEKERIMKCWLQTIQLISIGYGGTIFAIKCIMIANLYNPVVWSAMITSICASPLQFQIFIDFMQNLYIFSASEIITLKELFEKFQIAKMTSTTLQDEKYIKTIMETIFSETTNKEATIKTINEQFLGTEDRTSLSDFGNFIKQTLDARNIWDQQDKPPNLDVNKGLFSLAYSYFYSPLGRETLTTLKIALEAYGYLNTTSDFFSTYKTASPALFFKGIALNSVNSLSFNTYNKILVQNLFQNIVDMNPGILKDNFFLQTEIPILGENIENILVTTLESFVNVQITSSIKGYFIQLEKEAGHDPEAEKKREKAEKENNIDSVMEEIYQRGKKLRHYKSMGYSNYQIARIIDKPERSNNYKSSFGRCMKHFYNFFSDLEDPIILLDTYVNASFLFNLIEQNIYGILIGGISASMNSLVLSGIAHKKLFNLSYYTGGIIATDIMPMNILTLFLQFKYGNDTVLTTEINKWRVDFINNISSDLLTLFDEMQSVLYDSSLGMSLDKYLSSLNNTIIGNIFKMSCNISRFFLNYIGIPRIKRVLHNVIPVFNIPIIETLNDKQKCIRLFAFIDNKFSNIIRAFRESKLIDRLKDDLSQFANIGKIIQGTILPYLTGEQYFEWKPQLGSPFKGNIVKVLHSNPTDENKNKNANAGYDELLERMTSDIDEKDISKTGEIEKTLFIIDSDETFSNFKVIQMEEIETLFEKLTTGAENLDEREKDPQYTPSGLDNFVKLFKKENFVYTFSNLTKTVNKKAKEFWNWLSGTNKSTDASGNLLGDYSVSNIFYYYYLKLFLDEKGAEYKLNNFEFQQWLLQKSSRIMDDMGNMQTPNATGVEVAIINNILLSFPKRLLTQSAENDWFGARWWSYVSGTQGQLVSKIDIPPEGMEALKQFIGNLSDGAFIDDAKFVNAGYGLETTSISKAEFVSDDVFMGVNLRHNSYYGGYSFSPQIIKARDFLSTSEMLLALSNDESSEEIQKMSDLIIKLENESYSNPSVLASLNELNNSFQEPIKSLTQSLQFIIEFFTKNFYDEETSENNIPLKHMSFDYGLFYTKTSEMLKKCLYDVKNNVNIFTKIVEFMKSKNKYIVQYLQENCEIQFMCKDADANGKTLYLNKNGINMDNGDLANKKCLDNKVAIDYGGLTEEQFLPILLRPEIIFLIADNTTASWLAKKIGEENTKLFLSDEAKKKEEKRLQAEAKHFLGIFNNIAANGMKTQGVVNSTTLFDIIYDTISKQHQDFNASNEDRKLMSEYSKLYKSQGLNDQFWENIAVKMKTNIDENDMVYDKPAAYWEKKYYANYKLESLFKLGIILKDMKKRITDKDVKNKLIKYFSQKEDYLDKSNIFEKQIDEVNNLVTDIENICKTHLEDTKTFDKKALDAELTKLKNFYDKDSIKGEINLSNLNSSGNLAINKIEIDDAYFKLQKSEFNAIESELTKAGQALGQIWEADKICTSQGIDAHFIEYFVLREKWYKKQMDLFKSYILYNTNDFYSVFTNRYQLFSSQISNFVNEYSTHLNKIAVELQAKKIQNDKLVTPSIGDIKPITSETETTRVAAITGEEGAIVTTPDVTTVIHDKEPSATKTSETKTTAETKTNIKETTDIKRAQAIKETTAIKEESKISESVGQREGERESLANQMGYAGASPDTLSNLVDGLLKMLPSTAYTNIFAPPTPIESTQIEDTKKSNIKNQLEVCQTISNNWYIKYQAEHKENMKFQPTTIGDNISLEDANGCKETNLLYSIAKNTNYYIIKLSKWLGPILQAIIDALCRVTVPGGGSWFPHLNPCNGLAIWSYMLRTYAECIVYIFHDSLKKTFGDMDITKTGELNLGNYLGFSFWLQMINSLSAAEKDAGINRDSCNLVENMSDMNIRNLETDVYNMITERYNDNKYSSNNLPGFINIGQINEDGVNYSNPQSFLLALTTSFLTKEEQEEYSDFIANYEKDNCDIFYYKVENARKYLKIGLYSMFMNPTKNVFFDYLNCRFFDTTEMTSYTIIAYFSDPKNWANIWVDIRLLIKDFVVVLFANRELRPFFLTKIFGNPSLGNNKNLMRDLIDKSFSELDKKYTKADGTFNQVDYEVELDDIVGSTVSNLLQQFWDGLYSKFKTLEEGLPGIDDKIYSRFTQCRLKSCNMKEIKEIAEDAIQHVEKNIFTREADVDKYFFGKKNWISSDYVNVRNEKNDYFYNDSEIKILNAVIGLDTSNSGFKIKDSYFYINKKGEKTYISNYDDKIKSQIVRKMLTQYKEILSFYKKSLESSKTIKDVVNTRLKEESANFDLIFRYQNYEYYRSDLSMEGAGLTSNEDVLLNNYLVTPCNLHERIIFYKDDSANLFSECINISVFEKNEEYTTFQNEIIKINEKYGNDLSKYHREQSKKFVSFLEILKVDVKKICAADSDSDCIKNITTFINEVKNKINQKLDDVASKDEDVNNFITESANQYAKLLDEMKKKYTTKMEEVKKELENTENTETYMNNKTELESVIKEVEKIVTMINNIETDITNNVLKSEPYKSSDNIIIDFIVQEMKKTEDADYFAGLYLKLFNLQWDEYNSEKQKYILDHIQDIYKLYSLLEKENITYEELASGTLRFYIESNADVITYDDVNKKITEDKYKAAILKQFQLLFYKQSNFQYKYTIGKDTDFNIAIKDREGQSKIIPIKKDGDGFEMIKPLIEKNNINPTNAANIVKNAQDIIISGLENINEQQTKDDGERIKTLQKQIAENDPNGKKTVDLLNEIDNSKSEKTKFEKEKLAPINQNITKKVHEIGGEIDKMENTAKKKLNEKKKRIKEYNDFIDAEINAYNRITGNLDRETFSNDRKKKLAEVEEKLKLNKADYDKESARIDNEIATKENENAEILETLNDELQQILHKINTYIMEHQDITEAEVNEHEQLKDLINKENKIRRNIKEVDDYTIQFKEEKELERGTLLSWIDYVYWKSKYYEIITEPYSEGAYNWTDPYQWAIYFSKWGYEYASGKKLRPDDIKSMIDFMKPIHSTLPKSPKSAFDYYLEELNKKGEKITYEVGIQKWNELGWWVKSPYNKLAIAHEKRYEDEMKEFAKTHPEYNIKTRELNIEFLQGEVRDLTDTLSGIQTIKSQFKSATGVTNYLFWNKKIEEWKVDQVQRIIDDKDKNIFGYHIENAQFIGAVSNRPLVFVISSKDFEIYGEKFRIHELLQELEKLNDGTQLTTVRQGPNIKIKVEEPLNLKAINKEYQDMNNNIIKLKSDLDETRKILNKQSNQDMAEISKIERSMSDRKNDLIVVKNNAADTNRELEKEYANIQKIILDSDKSQYEKLLKKGFSLKISSNTNTIGLFHFNTYSDDYKTIQKHAKNGPINQKNNFLSTSKIDGGLPPILVGVVTDDITEGEINIGLEKQSKTKAEIAKLEKIAKITEEKEWPESPELKKELSSLESSEVHPIEKVSVKRIDKIIEDKYILLKDNDGKPIVDSKGNSIRILKMQLSSWKSTFDKFDEKEFGKVLVETVNAKYFRDEETYKKLNAEWWWNKPSQEDVNNAFGIDFEEYFNNLPIKGLDGKTIPTLLQEGEQVVLPHIPMNIYQSMYDNMMFDLDNNDVRFFIPQNNMNPV